MSFEEKLNRYAELLVTHGANVQEGQDLNLTLDAVHRDFAVRLVEAAYRQGARFVDLNLAEPRAGRQRLLHSKPANLEFVPGYVSRKLDDLLASTAASLRVIGSEDPDVLSDLDPKRLNTLRKANYAASRRFMEEGIGKSRVHWCVASAATPGWGKKVFPDLEPEEACARLWEEIFRICRADQENCLELWEEHNQALHARARRLTELEIAELRFQGPGTDLVVGLSPRARFLGGSDLSPRGVHFEPNIPTEEVFTTPDYRKTEGQARATRPFFINGRLVEDLRLEFEGGELRNFEASAGGEAFKEYIDSDEGGRRLGEVALVGIDSPIYQSGLVFQEILLDENAACHIAVGSAYKTGLEGGDAMSKEELVAVGCNESSVHTDMMISSEEVNVTAKTHGGDGLDLIQKGEWVLET